MMRARLIAITLALGVGLSGVLVASSASGTVRSDIHAARVATRHFQTPGAARSGGFTTLVRDKNGIACIAMPGMGAMGVHYLNAPRLDGNIRLRQPEVLVYKFARNGHLRLAALEYLTTRDDWESVHGAGAPRPRLFGKRFILTGANNRFGLPAYYSLHAWIWKHNPKGTFTMWNPRVYCPPGI
jgi:hypothetical protein